VNLCSWLAPQRASPVCVLESVPFCLRKEVCGDEQEAPQAGGNDWRVRDELMDREILGTLPEAKVLVQKLRRHYNWLRPYSSLGCRVSAPEAMEAGTPT
jgi:hypothetical protein